MRFGPIGGCVSSLVLALAITLAGCAQGGTDASQTDADEQTADTKVPARVGDAAGDADEGAAPAAEADSFSEENELLTFEYGYPAQAAAIAPLRAMLDSDRREQLAGLRRDATQFQAEAEQGRFSYNPYSFEKHWQVVTNLDRFLSLSADGYIYSGGAHGMSLYDSLIWDRQAGARLAPIDFFRSPAVLDQTVRRAFCAKLDEERAKRRGGSVGSDDMFGECIAPSEQTVMLGSSNRRTFDRIGFLVPPYAAGPYAEGDYEVTLPVTAAIIEEVTPRYRRAFSVAGR